MNPVMFYIDTYNNLYAQTLILVKSIVVKIIGFLVITRNHVGISGPY